MIYSCRFDYLCQHWTVCPELLLLAATQPLWDSASQVLLALRPSSVFSGKATMQAAVLVLHQMWDFWETLQAGISLVPEVCAACSSLSLFLYSLPRGQAQNLYPNHPLKDTWPNSKACVNFNNQGLNLERRDSVTSLVCWLWEGCPLTCHSFRIPFHILQLVPPAVPLPDKVVPIMTCSLSLVFPLFLNVN
jgi:hypothetical protein